MVWVNGHPHVPFEGYQRRPAPADPDEELDPVSTFAGHGLTPAQMWQAQQLLARAEQRDRAEQRERLKGPRFAARIAGIISAVKHGRVGNRAWGVRMQARHGGLTMLSHARHHLREISPAGVRASVSARSGRKAAVAFERNKARELPLPLPSRPKSFLEF